MFMALFDEIKILSKNGGLWSAFKWSLIAIPIILIFEFIGLMIPIESEFLSLLTIGIFESMGMLFLYIFALKKSIKPFGLKTYSLRVEYVAAITILLVVYFNVVFAIFFPSLFEFSSVGLLSIGFMFVVPYFIKK